MTLNDNSVDQSADIAALDTAKAYIKAETNVGDAEPQATIDSQEELQKDLLPKSIRGGQLDMTTSLRTISIPEATITGTYQLGDFLDSDRFTGISLKVLSAIAIDHIDTPVYIDGVANGVMSWDSRTDVWHYVPGTGVVFAIGDHTLSAVFTGGTQHLNTTTLTLEFTTIAASPL